MKATQSIIDQRKRREARAKIEANNAKEIGLYRGNLSMRALRLNSIASVDVKKTFKQYWGRDGVEGFTPSKVSDAYAEDVRLDAIASAEANKRKAAFDAYQKSHDESMATMKNITYHINKCIASLSKRPSFWQQMVRFFKR